MQVAVTQEEQLSGTERSDLWVREDGRVRGKLTRLSSFKRKDTSLVLWRQLTTKWKMATGDYKTGNRATRQIPREGLYWRAPLHENWTLSLWEGQTHFNLSQTSELCMPQTKCQDDPGQVMAHGLTVGRAPRLGKHREGRNNSISGLEAESRAREGCPAEVALELALSECVGEEKSASGNRMQQKSEQERSQRAPHHQKMHQIRLFIGSLFA